MTKYQIAFFDIDGTLIDSRNHKVNMNDGIPESTKDAIHKIRQAGIIPVIASGRHKEAVVGSRFHSRHRQHDHLEWTGNHPEWQEHLPELDRTGCGGGNLHQLQPARD